MKAPRSRHRLGIEPWKITELMVALGTIAINGPACGLKIRAAHRKHAKPSAPPAKIIVITPRIGQAEPRNCSAPAGKRNALDSLHDGLEIIAGHAPRRPMPLLSVSKSKSLRRMAVATLSMR